MDKKFLLHNTVGRMIDILIVIFAAASPVALLLGLGYGVVGLSREFGLHGLPVLGMTLVALLVWIFYVSLLWEVGKRI